MKPFQVRGRTEPINIRDDVEVERPVRTVVLGHRIPAKSDPNWSAFWNVISMERAAMETFKKLVKHLMSNPALGPFRHRGGAWLHGDPRHSAMLDLENIVYRLENTSDLHLLSSIEEVMKLFNPLVPIADKDAEAMGSMIYQQLHLMALKLKAIHELNGMAKGMDTEKLPAKRADYNERIERHFSLRMLTQLETRSPVSLFIGDKPVGEMIRKLVEGDEFEGFEWFTQLLLRGCHNARNCSECWVLDLIRAAYSVHVIEGHKATFQKDVERTYAAIENVYATM